MRRLKEKVTGATMPVSFSGYVLRPRKKTLPWNDGRYGLRNRQTIFIKKAHRRLIEGYKGLNKFTRLDLFLSASIFIHSHPRSSVFANESVDS